MGNRLATLGYFKKRLRDSGYIVEDLWRKYSKNDPRSWSVVIDPNCASVFCTCYQNFEQLGDDCFEIYDGGQFIPGRLKIKTNSIEVFVEHLTKFGIINKSRHYNKGEINTENTDKDTKEDI